MSFENAQVFLHTINPQTDSQTDSQTDPQIDSQTDPQTDSQTDPQADSQTDPQIDSQTDRQTKLENILTTTSNVDEDDDEEDNTHPQSATQTVTTLSDVDDSDVNGLRNLTMRKCSSDQIEVITRATAAAAARQRALNRATLSITATGIKSRMPTIPENEIPGDNLAPLPQPIPTQTARASGPDDFCLPGFIP
ncbi:uncharacterized protein [Haliotis cracherodii]|uniref:uncharacterized protein n=1 Tax=Haliotis cracherodii TaxID=6455 RepID=UPI0039EB7BA2